MKVISEFEIELSSIDVVSVLCNAELKAYCSFDDYENSTWDSEEKEKIVIIKRILEKFDGDIDTINFGDVDFFRW